MDWKELRYKLKALENMLERQRYRMNRQREGSNGSIRFIVEKCSCGEGPQQKAVALGHLTDLG
jgi:hypothetical protein